MKERIEEWKEIVVGLAARADDEERRTLLEMSEALGMRFTEEERGLFE